MRELLGILGRYFGRRKPRARGPIIATVIDYDIVWCDVNKKYVNRG